MSRPAPPRAAGLVWAVFVALLTAATISLLAIVPGLEPAGPASRIWPSGTLPTAHPEETTGHDVNAERWRVEPGADRVRIVGGILQLEAPPADPHATLRLPLPLEPAVVGFAIQSELRFTGRGGNEPTRAARLHLAGRDEAGRALPDRLEDAFRAHATSEWTSVDAIVRVPPEAASVELLVRLQRATGRLELRRLVVQPLREAGWRFPARIALALAWTAAFASAALLLVRVALHPVWAATTLLAGIGGLLLLLAPPELLAALLPRPVVRALSSSPSVPYLGHLGLSATLALLATRAVGAERPLLPLLLVLVLAPAAEAIQLLTIGREASVADALANMAGGLVGIAAALVSNRRRAPAPAEAVSASPAVIEEALPVVPAALPESGRR